MSLDKKLSYDEARQKCYEALYRDGKNEEALKQLFEFSMRYGEITPLKTVLERLSELGFDAKDWFYNVESYSGICQSVSDMMKKDDKEMLEMCLGTAKAGLVFSERSLFLRVAIVKCLIRLGRLIEAKEVCYELVRDTPNYVPAMIQEGVINYVEGRFEESLSIFQRVKLDPEQSYKEGVKTYEEKAGKFVILMKKSEAEIEKERFDEAIATITSFIDQVFEDKTLLSYEFLVHWYNSRAKCYEATNQMKKWFEDCLTSLNIKRTDEAEDLLGLYYTRKRELELEQDSIGSCEESVNEYESTSKLTISPSWNKSVIKFKMNWKAQTKIQIPLT